MFLLNYQKSSYIMHIFTEGEREIEAGYKKFIQSYQKLPPQPQPNNWISRIRQFQFKIIVIIE